MSALALIGRLRRAISAFARRRLEGRCSPLQSRLRVYFKGALPKDLFGHAGVDLETQLAPDAGWACSHDRRSRPRVRQVAGGSLQYWCQCFDSGRALGGAIAKSVALRATNGCPEAFDERLARRDEIDKRQEYEAAVSHQRENIARQRENISHRRENIARQREIVKVDDRREEYDRHLRSGYWRNLCRQAYVRADYICEHCRERAAIEVHHLHYRNFGHEKLEDVLALCRECHRLVDPRRARHG